MTPETAINGYINGLLSWHEVCGVVEDKIHPSGVHYLREMTEHMDSLHDGLREQNVYRLLQTWPLARLGLKMRSDDGA